MKAFSTWKGDKKEEIIVYKSESNIASKKETFAHYSSYHKTWQAPSITVLIKQKYFSIQFTATQYSSLLQECCG